MGNMSFAGCLAGIVRQTGCPNGHADFHFSLICFKVKIYAYLPGEGSTVGQKYHLVPLKFVKVNFFLKK